jgi:hypothetical protein
VTALLAAMGERIDAAGSGLVAAADVARAPRADVVLVDGVALPDGSLRPGAWLFLAPLAGETPFAVGEPSREPLVWRTAEGHPLVRDVDLATAYVSRAFPIEERDEPGATARGLAFAEGKAVVAEGERGGVRWVAIGLDPEATDLPVRAALPLLLRNAVLALARAPGEPLEPHHRVGRPLRPRVALPGGPLARVRSGAFAAEGVRIAPEGPTWTVPAAAAGEAEVATEGAGGAWRGRTAFLDLDPRRTVAPARPRSAPPAAVALPEEDESRWRGRLLWAALFLLVADLALVRGPGGRPRAPAAPGRA